MGTETLRWAVVAKGEMSFAGDAPWRREDFNLTRPAFDALCDQVEQSNQAPEPAKVEAIFTAKLADASRGDDLLVFSGITIADHPEGGEVDTAWLTDRWFALVPVDPPPVEPATERVPLHQLRPGRKLPNGREVCGFRQQEGRWEALTTHGLVPLAIDADGLVEVQAEGEGT